MKPLTLEEIEGLEKSEMESSRFGTNMLAVQESKDAFQQLCRLSRLAIEAREIIKKVEDNYLDYTTWNSDLTNWLSKFEGAGK